MEVAPLGVRVIGDSLHLDFLTRTVERAVGKDIHVVQVRRLVVRPSCTLALQRKDFLAVLDHPYVPLKRITRFLRSFRGKAAGGVRLILLAKLHDASALRPVPPQLDGRALHRHAGFRAVDRPAERMVAGLKRERKRRDRDMLREQRLLVLSEFRVRGRVEDVVSGLQVGRHGKRERLLGVVRLDRQRLLPFLGRLAIQVGSLKLVKRSAARVQVAAHRCVVDQLVERNRHKTKVYPLDVPRFHREFRPWRAPVALRLDRDFLRLDFRHNVGAHHPARRFRPFRRILGCKRMGGDKIALRLWLIFVTHTYCDRAVEVSIAYEVGFLRGSDRDDLGLSLVSR